MVVRTSRFRICNYSLTFLGRLWPGGQFQRRSSLRNRETTKERGAVGTSAAAHAVQEAVARAAAAEQEESGEPHRLPNLRAVTSRLMVRAKPRLRETSRRRNRSVRSYGRSLIRRYSPSSIG